MDPEFRNTKDWYLGKDPMSFVSGEIVNYIKKRAGKKILDFGCGLGGYSKRLNQLGFECTALDNNPDYVEIAKNIGVKALLQRGDKIDFPDGYFDTAVMIEVIEHLDDPVPLLTELRRVVSKNLLLTCPNNTEGPLLKKMGVIFEHMLETDHKQFYTTVSLGETLRRHFAKTTIIEGSPIDAQLASLILILPPYLSWLTNFGRPKIFFRLFAEALK